MVVVTPPSARETSKRRSKGFFVLHSTAPCLSKTKRSPRGDQRSGYTARAFFASTVAILCARPPAEETVKIPRALGDRLDRAKAIISPSGDSSAELSILLS